MFTRRRRAPRPSAPSGAAPHCRLCGTEVSVDEAGRCRLGHQVVAAEIAAATTPVTAPAADTASSPDTAPAAGREEPRRVTASPLDTLAPEEAAGGALPTAEPPAVEVAAPDLPMEPPAAPEDQPRGEAETERERLLEASSWFTDG